MHFSVVVAVIDTHYQASKLVMITAAVILVAVILVVVISDF